MNWRVASPKGSSNPKPISRIIFSVGVVAVFITFASWFFLSYPIGSTVHGNFNGVESSQTSGLSVFQKINTTSVDLHTNSSLDLVDNKPLIDLQPSIVSSGVLSDNSSKIEQIDTNSNPQLPLSESASPKIVPVTKDVSGLETSDLASKEPIPMADTNSSIMKGNISFICFVLFWKYNTAVIVSVCILLSKNFTWTILSIDFLVTTLQVLIS